MVASALAARASRATPSSADVAVGHVVAGLFHALMVEWAKEEGGGRSFESLLQEALGAMRSELLRDGGV